MDGLAGERVVTNLLLSTAAGTLILPVGNCSGAAR